jgi:hypothetical protein
LKKIARGIKKSVIFAGFKKVQNFLVKQLGKKIITRKTDFWGENVWALLDSRVMQLFEISAQNFAFLYHSQ